MAAIDEPAAAIAAGRCLVARSLAGRGGPVTAQHPRPCAWCDFPLEQLAGWIEGFNAWSGWKERARTYERHDARVFAELARRDPAEAERQIVAAQGLVAEPEPMAAAKPSPAHDPEPAVDEELAAWTS